jgi:hypothetical protein
MGEGRGEQGGGGIGFAEYLIERSDDPEELDRIERALARRRRELGIAGAGAEGKVPRAPRPVSGVLEYRHHQDGLLQKEWRVYRRKSDGRERERGPYWYFLYREGGKQKKIYLGKTDDPEGALEAKRRSRA